MGDRPYRGKRYKLFCIKSATRIYYTTKEIYFIITKND